MICDGNVNKLDASQHHTSTANTQSTDGTGIYLTSLCFICAILNSNTDSKSNPII